MSIPTTATSTRASGQIERIVRGCVHEDLFRRIGALFEARALVGRPEFHLVVAGLIRQLRSSDPGRVALAASTLAALGKDAAAVLIKQITEGDTDRTRARAVMVLGVVAAGGSLDYRSSIRAYLSGLLREQQPPRVA